jgi:hypothetical protein
VRLCLEHCYLTRELTAPTLDAGDAAVCPLLTLPLLYLLLLLLCVVTALLLSPLNPKP